MDAARDPAASAAPGQRWVVRMLLPDGRATDVIGWVDAATASTLLVDTGTEVLSIERRLIVAARRAPAAAGGPPPRRVPAEELERIALPGWLADHAPLGEWTLRAAGGFTGRANSCLAVGDPGMPVADAAAAIIDWCDRHGIARWAQVVAGSAEESALVALGWQPVYLTTTVLAARLADVLAPGPPDPRITLSEVLSPGWLAAYAESRPTDAGHEVVQAVLDSNLPRAFAAAWPPGTSTDQPTAIARGLLNRDWLGLAAIWTRPEWRRRGLAGALIGALGHWAARRGGRYAYLQVAAANAAAITAYERLGFAEHHRYGYLAAPD